MQLQKYFLKFSSSKSGLPKRLVESNRARFGRNVLSTRKRDGFLLLLLRQFGGFFSVILSVAAAILLSLGELVDFYVILVVIVLNAVIETIQRYRSDSIFETLVKTLPVYSLVVRNGSHTKIESGEIVAGDVVILVAGDKVPADGIVFYAQDFRVDEAILTGESRPVGKSETSGSYSLDSIIDNGHAVFSGSYVLTGEAHVLVCKVGNDTQLGQIAGSLSTSDTELPIQRNIKRLSLFIFVCVLALALFTFFVGLAQDLSEIEIFKTAVALFVSAIPESLPVMLTLVLAYGFKRMGDKHVLVRKMQSLDVLGQIDILALDKTGTITRNQMKVEKMWLPDGTELYVTGDGYEPRGTLIQDGEQVMISDILPAQQMIEALVLSSDGMFGYDGEKHDWVLETGDPTEVALLVLGQKFDITKEGLEDRYRFRQNMPFNNQSMHHEAVYVHGRKEVRFLTGAPEVIIDMSAYVLVSDSVRKMSDEQLQRMRNQMKEYAAQGYRVIATCAKQGARTIFLGMVAISDSVRTDVLDSVRAVRERNVDIIIITGDHREIALQVAKQIGLECDRSCVMTGDDMRNLSDRQLGNLVLQKKVFARVTPQQKLKILDLLKRAGKVVAMTGDGVNDSLALLKADIGIAMGKSSSEAAKEASDIVLMDDKFGSIVYGIEEGKNIFANIRKTIIFLLSTNFAEVFVVVFAITLALPLPLSAISILWLNLVTDTFLVIGFAFERDRIERRNAQNILGIREWANVIHLGMIMTCISLLVFFGAQGQGYAYAQGMTLLVLIVMQWFNVLNVRAGRKSVFQGLHRPNRVFLAGWLISLGLTIFAFYSSFMNDILGIQPVSMADWLYVVALGSSIVWLEELRKLGGRVRLFSRK